MKLKMNLKFKFLIVKSMKSLVLNAMGKYFFCFCFVLLDSEEETDYDSNEENNDIEQLPNAIDVAVQANLGQNGVEWNVNEPIERFHPETAHIMMTYYQVDEKKLCFDCTLSHCRRHNFSSYESVYSHDVYTHANALEICHGDGAKCQVCSIGFARYLNRLICPVCRCNACTALGFGYCSTCRLGRVLHTVTVKQHFLQ